MTDAELIEWLRKPYGDAMMERAADRIEALTKERDEADDLAKAAFAPGMVRKGWRCIALGCHKPHYTSSYNVTTRKRIYHVWC